MNRFFKRWIARDNWQQPDSWSIVLLDKVAKRGSGHTPSKSYPEYWNGDIKWVSLTDSNKLDNLYIYDTNKTITPDGIANSSAVRHPAGVVILSRDAGVGKSAITKDEMAVSQHFLAWNCGNKLDNHFLYYWLQLLKPEFERMAVGSTIKTIGLPYFKKLQILLPPFSEQLAIREILTSWDKEIWAVEDAIALKQKRKKGLMQQLLTGKVRFPEFVNSAEMVETKIGRFPADWQLTTLQEVGSFLKGKGIPKKEVVAEGLPCIRYGEIYTVHHDYIKQFKSFIAPTSIESSQKIIQGDLLFAGSGETLTEIGKCVAYTKEDEAYAGGDIVILRTECGHTEFLGYLMNHEIVSRQKYRLGQGHSVVHIYARYLKDVSIPFPTEEEQQKIASVLKSCDEEIALLQQKAEALRIQKKGLMQQLLTGKIRVNI